MTSESKKRKGKNSYMKDGGEKIKEGHMKRLFYFTKAQRNQNKKITTERYFTEIGD